MWNHPQPDIFWRSCDATLTPTSHPLFLPTDTEETADQDDEGMSMLASEDDDDERWISVFIIPWFYVTLYW